MKKILLVEDDFDLANAMIEELSISQFEVTHLSDGADGLKVAKEGGFAAIILDLMLPGLEGAEVCRGIRAFDSRTPIIIVTSRNQDVDKVLLLELGADDYVTKPFSVSEFRARIKAAVRRGEMSTSDIQQQSVLSCADLELDIERQRLTRAGQEIELTANELGYLHALMKNPGRVFSRENLAEVVSGYDAGDYRHSVSAAMSRLRAKLEQDPAKPKYVLTVRGVGYKFNDELE